MKNWRVEASIAILGLMVVSIVVARTYTTPSQPMIKPQMSIDYPPLRLTITLDKPEYATGENITATCTLKNISNETITVHFSQEMSELDESGPKPHSYRIYFNLVIANEEGSTVYSWESDRGARCHLIAMSLNPGDELGNSFLWNQKTKSPLPLGVQIPPGKYFVKATLAPRALLWIDNGPFVKMETPLVSFILN